jgi:SAM-dependent methyltransferase
VRPIAFDFNHRADLTLYPEMMDQQCSYEELRECLRSITTINRLTFAYRPTLSWLDALRGRMLAQQQTVHIVDVGCGYGDLLRRIHDWAKRHKVPVLLTGIDLNPNAVRAAREATAPFVATFHEGNAYDFKPAQPIDLVVNSLVMHHLEDAEIVGLLRWMESTARLGWFVNDLHRQPTPYRLFRTLVRFTTCHRFVKHDGAVSILRSFRHNDWTELLARANIASGSCRLRVFRPARLCVARVR